MLERIKRVRLTCPWNAGVMLIGAIIGAIASMALSVDSLILASQPTRLLGCDVNGRISCSSVARSWQSHIIRLWGTSVPNAFFGLILMGVFIGFTAALVFGYRPCKPVVALFTIGMICCVVFAGWLLASSVFMIKVVCPWCLTMDAGVALMVIGFIRWLVLWVHGESSHHPIPIMGGVISLGMESIPFLLLVMVVVVNM